MPKAIERYSLDHQTKKQTEETKSDAVGNSEGVVTRAQKAQQELYMDSNKANGKLVSFRDPFFFLSSIFSFFGLGDVGACRRWRWFSSVDINLCYFYRLE